MKLVKRRTFSRVIGLCSKERHLDTWPILLTQRMRFRMHSSPLTNTWISSKGRRKCRRGLSPLSLIVRGCNCGEGHDRFMCRSTSNSQMSRDIPCQAGLVDCGPNPEEEYREAELRDRLLQFAGELSPTLRRAFQLRDLDGLTTSGVGPILGVVEGTVKARVARRAQAHSSCASGARCAASFLFASHALAGCGRQGMGESEAALQEYACRASQKS